MKKATALLFVLVLSGAQSVFGQAPFGDSGAKEDALSDRLASADALYQKREEPGQCEQSVDAFRKILQDDPTCFEATWKAARAIYWIGTHAQTDAEKMELHQQGIDWANKAIELDANHPAGYFWLGVHYGSYGEAKGILKSLSLIGPIKEAMGKVISMDEKYQQGGAHRVLGRVFFKVPGIFGGSNSKAVKHLKKAIEIAPENALNHLFLADVYKDEDEIEKAKKQWNAVLRAPHDPDWAPEQKEDKEKARKSLEALEKKEDS